VAGADALNAPPSPNVIHFPASPGVAYLAALEKDFAAASKAMPADFLAALAPAKDLVVTSSPLVASNTASVNGQPHVFLDNFAGLIPHQNLKPSAEVSTRITIPASRKSRLHFLPFLGDEQVIVGTLSGEHRIFSLPAFDRSAVAWLEDTK
jgi:hypothetical protein